MCLRPWTFCFICSGLRVIFLFTGIKVFYFMKLQVCQSTLTQFQHSSVCLLELVISWWHNIMILWGELIKNVDDLQNKSRGIKDIYCSSFPLSFVLNIRYYIIRYVNSWPSNQINKQYPNNLVLPRINKPVKYCIYTNYQLFLNWKVFLSVNGLVIESFHPIIISHGWGKSW